ncbi:MAG: DUF4139 domain-containing protein [Candidatus Hydrothermae bacterium]|nr:DUF4139 domain-containing protein [Candidatus Hydrothermae bacterium]
MNLLFLILSVLSPLRQVEIHPNGAWMIYTLRVVRPGTLRLSLPLQVDTSRLRWASSTVDIQSLRWIPETLPDSSLPASQRAYLRLQQLARALQDSLRVLTLEESLRLVVLHRERRVPVEALQTFRQDMFSLYHLRRRLTDRLEHIHAQLETWRARVRMPSRRHYTLRLTVHGTGTLRLACWAPQAGWNPGLILKGSPFQDSLTLSIAARIWQGTDVPWRNVPAVLDTRPTGDEGPQPAPDPVPWFWGISRTKKALPETPALQTVSAPTPSALETGLSLRYTLHTLMLETGDAQTLPLQDTLIPARWFIEVRRDKTPHAAVTLIQPFPYALPEGFLKIQLSTYGEATGVTTPWPTRQSRTFWVAPLPEIPFRWEIVQNRTHTTRSSHIQDLTYRAVVTNPYGTSRSFRILLPEPTVSFPPTEIRDLHWIPPPDSVLHRGSSRFGVWWQRLSGGDSLEIQLRMKVVRPR